ncbi:MAG TPA: hypothetical protein VI056_07795 [Candidatus Limnocylindria bacterium]
MNGRLQSLSTIALAIALSFPLGNQAFALPVATVDQQQTVIDQSVGGLAIGGFYDQRLAQVVTAGRAGLLTEVRAPVSCQSDVTFILEIQGVTDAKPDGRVLSRTLIPGASLPSGPESASLRSLPLATPVSLSAGTRFAIVLDATGPTLFDYCGTFQGPRGESYEGGQLYFDSRPNAVGVWVCNCEFGPNYSWDLPFQTWMEPAPDLTAPSITASFSTQPNANGWHNQPVELTWSVEDAESGITSRSGCDLVRLENETAGTGVTCSAVNGAGLSASQSVTVRIDMTKPLVTYSGNLGSYTVDQTLAIQCQASDALSGLASSTCLGIAGPAYGFALGANEFSASATDRAGNTATASTSFTVRVNTESLCELTRQFVRSSAKYAALPSADRAEIHGPSTALCAKLAATAKTDVPAVIAAYGHGVDNFASQGWLTSAQASVLKSLASHL